MKKVDIWQQRYESLSHAVQKLEGDIRNLQQQNSMLVMEKRQWENEKAMQQAIIQKALANSNQTSNSYLEENKRLQEELKALKENRP
jgi:predicted  nucleic acid-binding Zn-ribbon protein